MKTHTENSNSQVNPLYHLRQINTAGRSRPACTPLLQGMGNEEQTPTLTDSSSVQRDNLFVRVLEQLPSGVILLDEEGVVIYANQYVYSLLNLNILDKKWRNIIEENFIIDNNNYSQVTLVSGEVMEISTSPLNDGDGQIIMLTDATETFRLQASMNENQRLSDLGKMAAFLAHQVRTPVATALLILSKMRHQADQKITRPVESVIARLKHLDSVITDILIYARGDRSRMETIGLRDFFDEFMFLVTRKAELADIRLTTQMNIDEHVFTVNQHLLMSALMNVVENSIEAMQSSGSLTINAETGRQGLVVRISDTGCGMSRETLENIFSPFYTTKGNGTGLGLAVLNMVINQHGGNVNVSSQSGKGSDFVISIPAAVKPE